MQNPVSNTAYWPSTHILGNDQFTRLGYARFNFPIRELCPGWPEASTGIEVERQYMQLLYTMNKLGAAAAGSKSLITRRVEYVE